MHPCAPRVPRRCRRRSILAHSLALALCLGLPPPPPSRLLLANGPCLVAGCRLLHSLCRLRHIRLAVAWDNQAWPGRDNQVQPSQRPGRSEGVRGWGDASVHSRLPPRGGSGDGRRRRKATRCWDLGGVRSGVAVPLVNSCAKRKTAGCSLQSPTGTGTGLVW